MENYDENGGGHVNAPFRPPTAGSITGQEPHLLSGPPTFFPSEISLAL